MIKLFSRLFGSGAVSIEQMMVQLREAGISLNSDVNERDFNEEVGSGDEESLSYLDLLNVLASERFDADDDETPKSFSDDIWRFDYECIEDHGAYAHIVANCVRLSMGELQLDDITDHVDIEEGVAWVEFSGQGRTQRVNLKVDDDWADPHIFVVLNTVLVQSGSERRLAQQMMGQDSLIVCKSPDAVERLNRLTGLSFEIMAG